MTPPAAPNGNDLNRDLGLGGKLAQQQRVRLLNRDGTFNVVRKGQNFRDFIHPYHRLLTMSWPAFFALVCAAYLATNAIFAAAYVACGPGALSGGEAATLEGRFANAFFFSVQTLATIGYGKMTPEGHAANLLVSAEALLGLLGFALATGILFARFSRPTARILFSQNAVVAPYRDNTGLMFRIANGRSNQLSEVSATVTLARFEQESASAPRLRRFYTLNLEREKVVLLPMQWVIVHPIDSSSPLAGFTARQWEESEAELIILLTAVDETFAQTVTARSSYHSSEILWGVKFDDMTTVTGDGAVEIDLSRLGAVRPAPLPAGQPSSPSALAKL